MENLIVLPFVDEVKKDYQKVEIEIALFVKTILNLINTSCFRSQLKTFLSPPRLGDLGGNQVIFIYF